MAIYQSSLSQFPLLQASKQTSISKPHVKTQILKIKVSNFISFTPNVRYPFLRTSCCCTGSSSSSKEEQNKSPSTRVFVKGLPQSTTEGSLKKAFSQYGEVSQVKIMLDKESKQSLGFAYVSFTSEESAKLAVQEMNGKFFDGRFIIVAIAKSDPSKRQVKSVTYKF